MLRLKSLILTSLIMLAVVAANGQKLRMNNGHSYRFAISRADMASIERGAPVTPAMLGRPDRVMEADEMERAAETAPTGLWVFARQQGNSLITTVVNRPPFRVHIAGERTVSEKNRILVIMADTDNVVVDDARVWLVRYGNQGKITRLTELKYCAQDMAYSATKLCKSNRQYGIEIEWRGYVTTYEIRDEGFRPRHYGPQVKRADRPQLNQNASWLVTDKNRYRPSELVRWKAVMIDQKGRPVRKQFTLMVNNKLIAADLTSNENGALDGSFLLTDSLDLKLDRYFMLRVAANSGVETRLPILYQDYELRSLRAKASVDSATVAWGGTYMLHINATDEKGDPMPEAQVTVSCRFRNADRIYREQQSFSRLLTDTVRGRLTNGQYTLAIPTDTWPRADLLAELSWQLRTPEGEQRSGSILLNYRKNLSDENLATADLYIHTINTADSVTFRIPSIGHQFRWAIYKNGRLADTGRDTTLCWSRAESRDAKYDLFATTTHKVEPQTQHATIRHFAQALNVTVLQPEEVEPGQEVDITVRVTDAKGRPVANADLTALSGTVKLNRYITKPEEWQTRMKESFPEWSYLVKAGRRTFEDSKPLTDPHLRQELGVDTVAFNRLAEADTITMLGVRSASGAQVVPLLVDKGKLKPFGMLFIDGELVYSAFVSERYAFSLNRGRHDFRFVTDSAIYSAEVRLPEPVDTKLWIAIPAASHLQTKLDDNTRKLYIARQAEATATIIPHAYQGVPYITYNGRITPLINGQQTVLGHPYISAVYAEQAFDQVVNQMTFYPGGNTVSVWPYERIVECVPNIVKTKEQRFMLQQPPTDDSLATEKELFRLCLERTDQYRSNFSLNIAQKPVNQNILTANADYNHRPINICYKPADLSDDFDNWSITSGRYPRFAFEHGRAYDVVILYPDSRYRALTVHTVPDSILYIDISFDSLSCRAASNLSLELENRIRHILETQNSRKETYSPFRPIGIEEEDFVENNYTMAKAVREPSRLAYGSMAKSVTMMDMSAENAIAAPEETSVEEEIVTMRSNFADVAYWQPGLTTDRNGQVTFRVSYPDDVTEWQECFVAIKGRQRGWAESRVRARKTETAKLNMPRFAIEGDSVGAVGIGQDLKAGTSTVDTIFATAGLDSLCMEYTYGRDGEHRCIPVYRRGIEAINASFNLVDNDTSLTLSYNPQWGPMQVNVYDDCREMLLKDVEKLAENDWCQANDYLAIRLMALRLLPQTTENTKKAEKLEKLILANRKENGTWSWWGTQGPTSLTTTATVLQLFGSDGVNEQLLAYLLDVVDKSLNRGNWATLIQVAKIYDIIDFHSSAIRVAKMVNADSLKSAELRLDRALILDEEPRFDTIRRETYTQGEYYSLNPNARDCWFFGAYEQIETTLKAYKYYQSHGPAERLKPIRRWLLQYVRRSGFMSERLSLSIIRTLWNDRPIEAQDLLHQLTVDGHVVTRLPYSVTVDHPVAVSTKGRRDFYISAEQTRWERQPEPQGNGMTISADIRPTQDPNFIEMHVTVRLDHDAEHVVVTVPIPAGCTYADEGRWYRGESGREQYRDRVNIFLEQCTAGEHRFVVKLNARYPGRYTVNPAQVKLIEFPVFNANSSMTQWTR